MSKTLPIWPALAKAAQDAGLSPSAFVYSLAKAGDKGGWFEGVTSNTGRIPEALFRQVMLSRTEWGDANYRLALAKGMGKFWHRAGDFIYLHGADSAARALGRKNAGKEVVNYPLARVRTVHQYNAAVMDSLLPATVRLLTRRQVHKLTGVSPTTQLRWEHEGITFHTDGRGRTPVESPATFYDYSGLLPEHLSARETIGLIRDTGAASGLSPRGFFSPKQGRLCRHAPKPFMSTGQRRRRNIHKKFRTATAPRSAGDGSARQWVSVKTGNVVRNKKGDWEQERVRRYRCGVVAKGSPYARFKRVVVVTPVVRGSSVHAALQRGLKEVWDVLPQWVRDELPQQLVHDIPDRRADIFDVQFVSWK